MSKGSKPRSGFNPQYRSNFEEINWGNKQTITPPREYTCTKCNRVWLGYLKDSNSVDVICCDCNATNNCNSADTEGDYEDFTSPK